MNKDQVNGRIEETKGKLKEAAGKAVGNEKLQGEGAADQVSGKVQSAVGDARQGVKDAAQKLIDKI
ncbi:MAG: CsbD family protein [Burkholderiaceae bacterium]|nr:CsbD family protein [Burkholderiaceae bacterium]